MPLQKSDLNLLNASEKQTIDKVIDRLSDMTATAISNYSHSDIPWVSTKENDVIDYELVLYREMPYSVRCYNDESPQ